MSVRAMFCKRTDIYHERGAALTPCDSISAGFRFGSHAALLGSVLTDEPPMSHCAPEADPANDTCGD
jgi:hypothetical protein